MNAFFCEMHLRNLSNYTCKRPRLVPIVNLHGVNRREALSVHYGGSGVNYNVHLANLPVYLMSILSVHIDMSNTI